MTGSVFGKSKKLWNEFNNKERNYGSSSETSSRYEYFVVLPSILNRCTTNVFVLSKNERMDFVPITRMFHCTFVTVAGKLIGLNESAYLK